MLAALMVSDLVVRSGRTIGELAAAAMTRLPQVLRNVTVDRPMPDVADRLADQLAEGDRTLGGTGRILVRPSGTEPVVRVMVEAVDEDTAEVVASRLCEAISTLR
jgi:phosphoglucosamine mutase